MYLIVICILSIPANVLLEVTKAGYHSVVDFVNLSVLFSSSSQVLYRNNPY